jgi:DNA-binding GntR family transcriptional regulator
MASSHDSLPDALKHLRLERQSTPSQITDLLESRILAGTLRPGERLRETQLAEMFGVSRNTVREAMRVLERVGLIRHVAHRGAEVTKLTPDDVADIYQARQALEVAGARTAAAALPRSLSALAGEVDALETAGRRRDIRALLDHDFGFHRLLVAQLGSERLNGIFTSLQRELRLALSQLDAYDPVPQIEEHREVLEALQSGDEEAAEVLLRRHLEVAEERVVRMLRATA